MDEVYRGTGTKLGRGVASSNPANNAGVRGGMNCMNPLQGISHTRKTYAVVVGAKLYPLVSMGTQSLQDAAELRIEGNSLHSFLGEFGLIAGAVCLPHKRNQISTRTFSPCRRSPCGRTLSIDGRLGGLDGSYIDTCFRFWLGVV